MVEEKIFSMIKDEFDIDEISRDMKIREDFEVDSISILEFVMDIEEEFDIEIDDDDIDKMITVGDVIDYVEKHK